MTRRRVLRVGTLVWAVLGAVVALASLQSVEDARLLVGAASILGPLHAVWAERRLSRHADRSAGLLLAVSAVLTPTYFAYIINLPALVVGLVLVATPHMSCYRQANEGPSGIFPRPQGETLTARTGSRTPPVGGRRRKVLVATASNRSEGSRGRRPRTAGPST